MEQTYLEQTYLEHNLSGADLSKANLSKADLSFTCILSFYLGRHFGYAWKKDKTVIVKIGCEEHPIEEWLKNVEKIGTKNRYTKEEINLYKMQLELISKSEF